MSTAIEKNLITYLKQIEDQSKKVTSEGYFHVDYVIDAFKKGEESGNKKAVEDIKETFIRATTQMFLYGFDLIKELEKKGFETSSIYVNPFAFKFMICTAKENTYNEDYIKAFFDSAHKLQKNFKEQFQKSMCFFFIQNDNLDSDELKTDGFFILD